MRQNAQLLRQFSTVRCTIDRPARAREVRAGVVDRPYLTWWASISSVIGPQTTALKPLVVVLTYRFWSTTFKSRLPSLEAPSALDRCYHRRPRTLIP